MSVARFPLLVLTLLLTLAAGAQKILYSEPARDDNRRTTFEVIGKVGPNYLVYKNNRGRSYISAFDNNMKDVANEPQNYLPEERLINVDFFNYPDHVFVVYEYQRKNVVYCEAVKVDAQGRKLTDPQLLDTAHINAVTNNKIYSVIGSEDKSHLMVFKINSRNKNLYRLNTVLFDSSLKELGRSSHNIPMEERDDNLGQFQLDNDGDLVFARFTRVNDDNINQVALFYKAAGVDSLLVNELKLDKIFLDELKIKADNPN